MNPEPVGLASLASQLPAGISCLCVPSAECWSVRIIGRMLCLPGIDTGAGNLNYVLRFVATQTHCDISLALTYFFFDHTIAQAYLKSTLVQAGLRFIVFLPSQLPEFWDYRCMSPQPGVLR